jgi:polysaccharide deacetylase family protein (PEP-CTERM system associated)
MNILTFDIEEWFHILDNETTKTSNEWSLYESRIHMNMNRILHVLKEHKQKATFFCLGWIARKYPEIIRELVNEGYEIGSHGDMHQLAYEQTPDEFRKDVEKSIKTLEDVSGQKIKYYRAPGFSIKEENAWAFKVLAEYGIEVDCSVFPAPRAHGGFPSYSSPVPSLVSYENVQLKELPISYATVLGRPVIFSGGGYFRLFPYALTKRYTAASAYLMSYLHPRDFDATQPMIAGLSLSKKFKSYVGIPGAMEKFERWISEFGFIDIRGALDRIDWNHVPVVRVG